MATVDDPKADDLVRAADGSDVRRAVRAVLELVTDRSADHPNPEAGPDGEAVARLADDDTLVAAVAERIARLERSPRRPGDRP